MVKRIIALQRLVDTSDKQLIKVITGIRRCGKSVLLQQFYDHLLENGVDPENIIFINFESLNYENLQDYHQLYEYVKTHIQPGRNYLLLDEIQEVSQWEKAVASFQVDFDCDITITGSNAYLLSSDLSTYIAGRYIELHLLPLSFKEYISSQDGNSHQLFRDYVRFGGFPGLLVLDKKDEIMRSYLDGIYSTIVLKDILARNNFRDVDLLEAILAYMVDNIGNLVSATNIANYLTSNGRKTDTHTVLDYLQAFEKAFILYKAERYNLKGKKILRSPHKYYVADIGLRNATLGFRDFDLGYVLENLVYLELVRRGYDVRVGVDDSFELDFIATKEDEKSYYQVALSLTDERVLEREMKGLLSIRDNYPKVILSMDYRVNEDLRGIRLVNVVDFLLGDGSFTS